MDIIEAQQAQIEALDTEVEKRLREREALAHVVKAQQARIAELRKVLKQFVEYPYREGWRTNPVEDVLAHTDDLSALAAHDAEVRRKALLEAADICRQFGDANLHFYQCEAYLLNMAEGKK